MGARGQDTEDQKVAEKSGVESPFGNTRKTTLRIQFLRLPLLKSEAESNQDAQSVIQALLWLERKSQKPQKKHRNGQRKYLELRYLTGYAFRGLALNNDTTLAQYRLKQCPLKT